MEIRSRGVGSGWVVHATALVERGVLSVPEASAFGVPVMRGQPSWIPRNCIGGCGAPGSIMGRRFGGSSGLSVLESGAARAEVRLPSAAKRGSRRFLLHPVMVDIALQALGATRAATDLAAGRAR